MLTCDFYVWTKVIQIVKKKKWKEEKKKKREREREKKKTKSKEFPPIIFFFLHLFGLQLSRRIVIIVYMRCTCIVHNIFFLFCVLKVLNLTRSGFQCTCFWPAGSESFRVATGTSTISWTRERSAPMLWSLLTSVGLLGTRGQRDPTEPWGSECGWTVKAEPVCVRKGFPCSCGASYYYWLHTWRALPSPSQLQA